MNTNHGRCRPSLGIACGVIGLALAIVGTGSIGRASLAEEPSSGAPPLVWLHDLDEGRTVARNADRPLLVVAGARWCSWCLKQAGEFEKSEVRAALERFTLVDLDIDEHPDAALELTIGSIPAMRILLPDGRLVVSRQGFLAADELALWLDEQLAALRPAPISSGPPDAEEMARLLVQLGERNPAARESAQARLAPYPTEAAVPVVSTLGSGNLQIRLALLDLLHRWGAPCEGLDPWMPESFLADRLKKLEDWASEQLH